MQEFYVYILRCSDGSFYTGHTDDLEKRISEHQTLHYHCYTSSRLPVELIFHATFGSRDEAIAAERQIKGWSRAKKQALADNDFDRLHVCTKKQKE
jgi:predicted GIY-YIG superfamily endonuclease